MAGHVKKELSCVFEYLSFEYGKCYSRPFKVAGCVWRLVAFPKKDSNDGYLSMYLELAPGSSPPGWRRNVKFTLTPFNVGSGESHETARGTCCFDAVNNSWGFEEFLPFFNWGYVVNCTLIIHAELDVFPAIAIPEEPVKILSCKEGNQASDASVSRSQGGSSCQVAKKTENPSNDSLDENGGRGFNTVASVTETSNDGLKEIQPVKETMDVNGFEVISSQVESVRRLFERHPDIAVEFQAKNLHLRNACMNFLLSLIETLCQSLEELSNEDLVEVDIALSYLKDAGFKVDWLEKKLEQLKDKKEKEQSRLSRLQEIEENLLILKQKCSELDALVEEEKAELSVMRTALSFNDFV